MWMIWNERNKVVFEDERFSFDRLKSFFLMSFCSWASLLSYMDCSLVRRLFCIIDLVCWAGRFLFRALKPLGSLSIRPVSALGCPLGFFLV